MFEKFCLLKPKQKYTLYYVKYLIFFCCFLNFSELDGQTFVNATANIADSEFNPNPLLPGYISSFGASTFFLDVATEGSVMPGEICNNGIDDDGDGYIDGDDPDCISVGTCGCPSGGITYTSISSGHTVPAGAIHCLTGDVDLTSPWNNITVNGSFYIVNNAHLDIDGGINFGNDGNLIVCEGASYVHQETGVDYPNNIYNFGWLQICGTVTNIDSIIVGENSLTAIKGNGLNFEELFYVGDSANNAYLFFDIATSLNGSSGTICLPGGTSEMIVEIDASSTTPDCVTDCNGCPELASITETCNDGSVEAAYISLNSICTYDITDVNSGTFTVNAGETICLYENAEFTGTINLFGGTLINNATAVQTFTLITNSGSPNGIVDNFGSIHFPSNHIFDDGIIVNNDGVMSFGGDLDIIGGAVLNNTDSVHITDNLNVISDLNNSGELIVGLSITGSASSTIINSGLLESNNFTTNNLWTNSGIANIRFSCVYNSSASGTITGGCFTCNNWTNRGLINGTSCGNIIIQSNSEQTSAGSLTGDIAIIDQTPPGTAPFIDTNNGSIGTGIVWNSCTTCTLNPSQEICGNGIDDDGDGDVDCADGDCTISNFAISQTSTGVINPNNAIGATDDLFAELDSGDVMIIDLGSALDTSYGYFIRGLGTNALVTVEESIDGVNYFTNSVSPRSINFGFSSSYLFTTEVHTRYLRLTIGESAPGGSFNLDAIFNFGCDCQPTPTMTEETQINFGTYVTGDSVTVPEGDFLRLEFIGNTFDSWTFIWSGPNSLYQVTDAGMDRDRLELNNIQANQAGTYKVYYFDDAGCVDSTSFEVTVSIPEICNNGIDDDGDGYIDCADGDCTSFDTDADLICDYLDLDDDNDGIPDTDEGCQPDTILVWNALTPAFSNVSNGSPSGNQSVTYTNEAGDFDFIFEVDNPEDNYFNQFSIGNYHALGIDASALDSLVDFAELTIHIDNVPVGVTLQEIQFTIDDIDRGGNIITREVVTVVGYNGLTPISPTVTAQQTGFLVIDPPAVDQSVKTTTTTSDNLPFLPGDTNAGGTAEQAAIDVLFDEPIDRIVIRYSQTGAISSGGLGIRQFMGSYCDDSDGDGISNSLDLDSDNDGIYDLEEAGHGQADVNGDGIMDGLPIAFGSNGLFDGVETVTDNDTLNYVIADSESTPDGIYDAYELEADGDGCNDTEEALVADGDNDGIAGTGVPTVNLEGLVNGIIYGSVPNNDWQNPAVSPCTPVCDALAPGLSKN